MADKRVLVVLLSVLCFLFSMAISQVFAAESSLDANVTIQSVSEITVKPGTLNWTNVALGAAGGNKTVTIENTGSENITNVYVYVDTIADEAARPYQSDDPSSYATGGVLTVSNSTAESYYFAGRLEWNWTENLQNLNTTNVNSPMAWGFFKNTSSEYVWVVGNGTGGTCNNTGTQFALDDDDDQGTMATRTPETTSVTRDDGDADYSYFQVDRVSSPLEGYCVAVSTDCTKIYIYKYDKRTGFTDCTNSEYLSVNDYTPSSKYQISMNAFIPKGLPNGEMSRATVTFVAS